MEDAILWVSPAPHLLPLVPTPWVKAQKKQHAERILEWRREKKPFGVWRPEIDIGSGAQGVRILSVDGEIGYHTDIHDFPVYCYLLVLREADYVLTGRKWQTAAQPRGTVIAFSQHKRHALAFKGMESSRKHYLTSDMVWTNSPCRTWITLIFDCNELHTPESAIAEFEARLRKVPWTKNMLRKQELTDNRALVTANGQGDR
jgi:hypothetical protein